MNQLVRVWRWGCVTAALAAMGAVVVTMSSLAARAQQPDVGAEMNGPQPMGPPGGDDSTGQPPPIHRVPLSQSITGSMMVSPPYGNAPLRVGFFVLANDPENIGFLTYQWNFGDGTVSSLPPELYIFHSYPNPGTYLCSLVVKTVDGRSRTFFQGVVVKNPAG
jgi:hypothetical protein